MDVEPGETQQVFETGAVGEVALDGEGGEGFVDVGDVDVAGGEGAVVIIFFFFFFFWSC